MKQCFALLLFLLVSMLGCRGGTEVAPVKSAKTHEVVSKDGSFSVQLPMEWARADSSDPAYAEVADRLKSSKVVSDLKKLEAVTALQVVAVDLKQLEANSTFLDNLNVVVLPLGPGSEGTDRRKLAQEAAEHLLGKGVSKIEVIQTPNGPAGIYSGQTTAGSKVPHDLIGAVVDRNGSRFTLTLSTGAGKGSGFMESFQEIVRSLKFR